MSYLPDEEEKSESKNDRLNDEEKRRLHDDDEAGSPMDEANLTPADPHDEAQTELSGQENQSEISPHGEWIRGEAQEEDSQASGDEGSQEPSEDETEGQPQGGEEREAESVTTDESAEVPRINEKEIVAPVGTTLEGIQEIVDASEDGEASEAELREEAVDELAHIIEAIIFASDEPLTANTIKSVLDASHTFGRLNVDVISARVAALNNRYEAEGSGFRIVEIANGYQFATRKEMAQWVSNLFKERSKRKLSMSALESLAIIAYKQPITKPEIESIRGVNVDYVLHSLLEKELVTVVGRAETVGRPLLYGTTQRFLKVFALKNLDDLPKLREIDEIIKEIKSKGTEESIQLEITALDEELSRESKGEGETKQENS